MYKTAKSSSLALKKERAAKSAPTQEDIAQRAYEIYLERGGGPGHELDDWTRAGRELGQNNGHGRRKSESKIFGARPQINTKGGGPELERPTLLRLNLSFNGPCYLITTKVNVTINRTAIGW